MAAPPLDACLLLGRVWRLPVDTNLPGLHTLILGIGIAGMAFVLARKEVQDNGKEEECLKCYMYVFGTWRDSW
jgi:hypothetical protein